MDAINMIKNMTNGENAAYESILDFNTADISKAKVLPIPHGTIAKVIMNIKAGGYESDPYLSKSAHSGAIYLHAEFIVLEGPFVRRRIFQNIGIIGAISGEEDVFGARGRSLIRGLIESAKGIQPNDNSEEAQAARKISNFRDLNGLVCVVKIGIEKDKSGKLEDRNTVICAITPNKKEYQAFMERQTSQDDGVWF